MTSNDRFAAEIRKRIAEATAGGPRQVFADAVASGLIDKEGRVTRLFGGDAEPDPSARRITERTEPAED